MAPISEKEQLQFLLSCIRFSNSGKIDFEKVANECEIVSKGAAAKRYERLLKANDINPSSGGPSTANSPAKSTATTGDSTATTPTPTPKKKAPRGGKRKAPESKGSPKKAKLMKKAAVVCAEDLLDKVQEESDKEDEDDDEDGSLFKGVVPDMDTNTADTYL